MKLIEQLITDVSVGGGPLHSLRIQIVTSLDEVVTGVLKDYDDDVLVLETTEIGRPVCLYVNSAHIVSVRLS